MENLEEKLAKGFLYTRIAISDIISSTICFYNAPIEINISRQVLIRPFSHTLSRNLSLWTISIVSKILKIQVFIQ